jgi:predicted NBD/HSP70 family sugar kinase
MPAKLYSAINVFDPREIIVVGLGEIKSGQDPMKLIQIEVEERLERPLEAVIEPEIGRTFGIVVSEDDFSSVGEMKFKPASIQGKETDFGEIAQGLKTAQKLLIRAAAERDASKKLRSRKKLQ